MFSEVFQKVNLTSPVCPSKLSMSLHCPQDSESSTQHMVLCAFAFINISISCPCSGHTEVLRNCTYALGNFWLSTYLFLSLIYFLLSSVFIINSYLVLCYHFSLHTPYHSAFCDFHGLPLYLVFSATIALFYVIYSIYSTSILLYL